MDESKNKYELLEETEQAALTFIKNSFDDELLSSDPETIVALAELLDAVKREV